jgi:PPK2 family polyphosphate:nucleotide phosphotransferase
MKIDPKEFRVREGDEVDLRKWPTRIDPVYKSKEHYKSLMEEHVANLNAMQEVQYASNRYAVLMILQGMDASGKDGAVRHVMSGVNPQGCRVYSFKQPTEEELAHDFLWRTSLYLPERGRIAIFNRSYYEEVLVVRVHPELLGGEKIPGKLVTENIWQERFEDINSFERYLSGNGIIVLKIFLHLSKKEQKRRFLERLEDTEKNWKFSMSDVLERQHWEKYMRAYEDMIRNTSTKHAPWYVVPADHKWFARLVVAEAIIGAMESLDLSFPKMDAQRRKELKDARAALEHEG